MKITTFIFIAIFAIILQIGIFSHLSFLSVKYQLFFSIAVFIGIRLSWYEGCLYGMWLGLLTDIFNITPFGFTVFIFGLSGFLSAFFETIIFTQHIGTKLLILFVMSIFSTMLAIILLNGFSLIISVWSTHKLHLLSIASVNTLFSIPLYIFLSKLSYHENQF